MWLIKQQVLYLRLYHTECLCWLRKTECSNNSLCSSTFSVYYCSLCVFTSTFLADKWQGPGENVHEVGQPVRVRWAVELSDVHHVVLVLQHCRCGGTEQTRKVVVKHDRSNKTGLVLVLEHIKINYGHRWSFKQLQIVYCVCQHVQWRPADEKNAHSS